MAHFESRGYASCLIRPTIIYDYSTSVTLPENIVGDHCSSGNTEFFCGYWYNQGWSDPNMNEYPDPEDWGEANLTVSTWISCMFR